MHARARRVGGDSQDGASPVRTVEGTKGFRDANFFQLDAVCVKAASPPS